MNPDHATALSPGDKIALEDKITLALLVAIMLLGLGVLAGWHLHIRALIQLLPGTIPMQYNTALCFFVLGASAWALIAQRGHWLLPTLGGGFVALAGALNVFQYATGISLGIDTALFYPWDLTLTSHPGRMALTTALSFASAGSALALLALRRRSLALFAVAHILPLSLGLTSVCGYLIGITSLSIFGLGVQMAVHTALAFTAYGGAMLCYAWRRAPRSEEGLPKWSPGLAATMVPIFFVAFSAATQSSSAFARLGQLSLALASAALLGLAIHKLMRASIVYKGLILISIPLVFVLAFVGLVAQLKRNDREVQAWALHSKEVIERSQSLFRHLVDGQSSIRGYVITGNPAFAEPYYNAVVEVPKDILRLQELVRDNPEQKARAQQLAVKAVRRMDVLADVEQLVREGNRDRAAEQVSSGVGKRIMDELRQETETLLREEHRFDAARRQTVAESWQRLNWLLVAGVSADILLALMLAYLFSRGISKRLLTLTENAQALAVGKELARPLTGKDEIAHLDQVFHKMARALDASAKRERAVVENALDVICSVDADGRFARVNPASFKAWGYSPEELVGRRYTEFVVPEDVARSGQKASEIIVGQPTTNFENEYLRKDGTRVCMLWSASWSESEQLMFCVGRDITERKWAESAINKLNESLEQQKAQLEAANKELEAFSYSISHDLRAPLRAMNGFTRILLEEYANGMPEEAKRYLHVVRNNAEQMGQLVDDLLAFSRLSRQPLQKQQVAPTDLVHRILGELQSEQNGRRIDVSVVDLPVCQADPALLKQVFFNLLANSLKYTQGREPAVIEVGSLNGEDHKAPVYFVKDNGVGFDMQYAHKLFSVFQRLHRAEDYEGTGVGLAIVHRIIQRHGGRIWAEAELNKGATFYFTLEGSAVHE